jgi:hypothetical protein
MKWMMHFDKVTNHAGRTRSRLLGMLFGSPALPQEDTVPSYL